MNKNSIEELIECQIDNFIINECNKTISEVRIMPIYRKMELVNTKSKDKWNDFKFGLRKAGYII